MRRSKDTQCGDDFGVPAMVPTLSIFVGCCARAASGQAAAPPRSVMNSRRLMAALVLGQERARLPRLCRRGILRRGQVGTNDPWGSTADPSRPSVFATGEDPVRQGLVTPLGRPSDNLTASACRARPVPVPA